MRIPGGVKTRKNLGRVGGSLIRIVPILLLAVALLAPHAVAAPMGATLAAGIVRFEDRLNPTFHVDCESTLALALRDSGDSVALAWQLGSGTGSSAFRCGADNTYWREVATTGVTVTDTLHGREYRVATGAPDRGHQTLTVVLVGEDGIWFEHARWHVADGVAQPPWLRLAGPLSVDSSVLGPFPGAP